MSKLPSGSVGERHVRRALLADRAGQAAGVDPADADPALLGQPAGKLLGGAPVGGLGRVPLHHHARGHRLGGLVVLGIDADIADMGEGEGHHLAGIGRVGHDFLVTGHRGVEAQLGGGLADGAEPDAGEDRPVGEREAGGGLGRCCDRHGRSPRMAKLARGSKGRAGAGQAAPAHSAGRLPRGPRQGVLVPPAAHEG